MITAVLTDDSDGFVENGLETELRQGGALQVLSEAIKQMSAESSSARPSSPLTLAA